MLHNDCNNINTYFFAYYFKMLICCFKNFLTALDSMHILCSRFTKCSCLSQKKSLCSYLPRFYAAALPETTGTDMSYAEIIYRQLESLIMQAE
jgi:uncharacterized membrane protein YfhO